VSQDRAKLLHLLKQRGTFTEQEITVAMELIGICLDNRENKDYHIFCAAEEGDIVTGYICFGPIPMTEGCYDLYWIAVEETQGRKGVGGRLLAWMEEFVLRYRGRRIYIDTSSTPAYGAARSFYEKHGFSPVCLLEDYYRVGDHKMILMKEVG